MEIQNGHPRGGVLARLSYLREKNSIPDVMLSWVQKVGRGLVRSKSLNRHPPVG